MLCPSPNKAHQCCFFGGLLIHSVTQSSGSLVKTQPSDRTISFLRDVLTVLNFKDAAQILVPPWDYLSGFSFFPLSSSARMTTQFFFFFLYCYLRIYQVPCMNVSSVPPLNTQSLVDSTFILSLASSLYFFLTATFLGHSFLHPRPFHSA